MFRKAEDIKISVIIPVYNCEKTIKRCLDSILKQTLDGIEIIVINDGSEDSTIEILNEYAQNYDNILVINSKHVGQGLAKNIGMEQARGEYIGFVDGDDAANENMYKCLYDNIQDADICQCNEWVIYDNGRYKPELKPFAGVISVKNRIDYVNEFLFKCIHSYGCCNKLFRKSFLDKNNIHFADNNEVYSEDLYFNILTAKSLNKIVFIDEVLYYYYQHKNSHSKIYTVEKVKKMCKLFSITATNEYKYVISRLAVLIICLNLAEIEEDYTEVMESEEFRMFLKNAIKAPGPFYQKIIYLSLLVTKGVVARGILRRYYKRFQEEREHA